jgi:hypothetical protein
LLAALLLLGLLSGPSGAPSSRPLGAGLPPGALSAVPPPPVLRGVQPPTPATGPSLAASIAEEEQRLAALRSERAAMAAQLARLRAEAEQLRRGAPAPKDEIAGSTPQAAPSTGGGPVRAEPAAAAVPEPTQPDMRIFVHHRVNSRPGAAAAAEVAENLRDAGLAVADVRSAPFVPSTPVVRYFHQQDQEAAARLAGRLGRGWAIQDFRAFEPQPPPRTLEVWLPAN